MVRDTDFRVSLVQMQVTGDREHNVEKALEYIYEAAEDDPELIVLPENFNFTGTDEEKKAHAETMDGPTLPKLQDAASDLGVHVVAGSIKMEVDDDDLLRNVSVLIDPDGEVQETYEKMHIFNANVGGNAYTGDNVERGGDDIVIADVNGVDVGMTICFDVRYPELFRILGLEGADVVLVPAMFTLHTGKDHWDHLLCSRAIENQYFVVAPGTCKQKPGGAWTYGRSLVADPWGTVTNKASDGERVITADLDLSRIEEVREKVPTLPQRRPDAYDWPDS
ncbi:carbon-nitrogen hydrolase family protein [Natrarchaeobius oligotrophus]|nr:carbon-nitrogen hydrolase family protein [Natrarchaeobius chitinivorans]